MRSNSFWKDKLNILDIIILKLRKNKVLSVCDFNEKIVADTWSWYNALFLNSISKNIKKGYAIDLILNNSFISKKIIAVKSNLNDKINLPNKSVDIIISMAILEHLDNPDKYLIEVLRVLNTWWQLIMTVPSKKAKPVLEFLAYKLKIISKEEIKDHKTYYNKESLEKILWDSWFEIKNIKHKYFQFWMNNLITYIKK